MSTEEKRAAIENLLQALPDVVSPMQIARTLHQSKNLIYTKSRQSFLQDCRVLYVAENLESGFGFYRNRII